MFYIFHMVSTIMFHTNFLNPLSIKNSYSDSHNAVFTLMFGVVSTLAEI